MLPLPTLENLIADIYALSIYERQTSELVIHPETFLDLWNTRLEVLHGQCPPVDENYYKSVQFFMGIRVAFNTEYQRGRWWIKQKDKYNALPD